MAASSWTWRRISFALAGRIGKRSLNFVFFASSFFLWDGGGFSGLCGWQKDDTLLHVAARKGHVDIVQYLINNGSDPMIRNANSDTPLATARKGTGSGKNEVISILMRMK